MLVLREPRSGLDVMGDAEWREVAPDEGIDAKLLRAWHAAHPVVPPELAAAFAGTPYALFEPLLGIPSYEVDMPGGSPVRNDLFVLGRIDEELAVLMLAGRTDSHPGEDLDEWLRNPWPSKLRRIGFLQEKLELPDQLPDNLHYQILNRITSSFVEAERQRFAYAAAVVQVFGAAGVRHNEYQGVVSLLGMRGRSGRLEKVPGRTAPELWIAWVES